MADAFALLALLVGLELVLGVDNILVVSLFVGRLPAERRHTARVAGLGFALIARLLMLLLLLTLSGLTNNLFFHFSIRDLILLAGGLFLLVKAVREIHHTVEMQDEEAATANAPWQGFTAIIVQLVLLDLVFSIDSVITAIGLTDQLWIIIGSVVISFVAILLFAGPIGEFILAHPALKILALAFLITIGVTLFLEGLHKHVPKGYIYLPMGFALLVELLQMRYEHNRRANLAHIE